MAVPAEHLQTAGYIKRTARGTSGDECCVCGRQTAGVEGALFVALDHCNFEFVTDEEAERRGESVSLFPIGPECVKRWRKAVGGTAHTLAASSGPIVGRPAGGAPASGAIED